MENATEALKMAFAVLVFIIAITVAFILITEARSTADVIFTAKDDQDYVENITSIGQKRNENYRVVGTDTIVPTIYRYAQENYGVIIIDNNEIVGIYDLVVENTVSKYSHKWKNNYAGSSGEINKVTGIGTDSEGNENIGVLDYVKSAISSDIVDTSSWDEGYFRQVFGGLSIGSDDGIYKIKNPSSISCPWTSSTYNIMQRIKVDLNGGQHEFGSGNLKYIGAFGNEGFIKKYKDNTFKEYYYNVKAINNLTGEEETDRIQIIYVKE